jgi:hypothetical protein
VPPVHIWRRSYQYMRAPDVDGRMDAGHAFCCFQRKLSTYIDMQQRLENEILVPFITPTPYAAWVYSCRRPPSPSRRVILMSASTGSGSARSGVACFSARCGRWLLKWDSYSVRTLRRWQAFR